MMIRCVLHRLISMDKLIFKLQSLYFFQVYISATTESGLGIIG